MILRRVLGVVVALIGLTVVAVLVAGNWRPQRLSSFSGSLRDADGHFVQRAEAIGRDADGGVVVRLVLVGAKWTIIDEAGPEWGRSIEALELDAPGCRFATPATVQREVHGSPYSHLSPHPNSYRIEWRAKAQSIACPEHLPLEARWAEHLAAELIDEDLPTRWAARSELRRLKGHLTPFEVPLWKATRESLDHLPADEHPQVLATFGVFGSVAAAGVPLVSTLLDDPQPGVRKVAVTTLEQLGAKSPGVAAGLLRALADTEPTLVVDAAAAIGRLAPDLGPDELGEVESALIALLGSEAADLRCRHAAFAALHKLGTPAAQRARERWAKPLAILL
jgi:hypothetical protein